MNKYGIGKGWTHRSWNRLGMTASLLGLRRTAKWLFILGDATR